MQRQAPKTVFHEQGTIGLMVWAVAFVSSLRPELTTEDEVMGDNAAILAADIAVARFGCAMGLRRT